MSLPARHSAARKFWLTGPPRSPTWSKARKFCVGAHAARRARQPIGHLVTAEEVAHAIAYLASPHSSSTTGTLLEEAWSGRWVRPGDLATFRRDFYRCLIGRGDALFELADAVFVRGRPGALVASVITGVRAPSWARHLVRRPGRRPGGRRAAAHRVDVGAVAAGGGRADRPGGGCDVPKSRPSAPQPGSWPPKPSAQCRSQPCRTSRTRESEPCPRPPPQSPSRDWPSA